MDRFHRSPFFSAPSIVRLTTLLIASCLAAAAAHTAIDILGDYVLVHDTYDDVQHEARTVLAVLAVALAGCSFVAALAAAVQRRDGGAALLCAFRGAAPRRAAPFVAACIATATVMLVAMECCDTLIAGRVVDDIGDLLGGSPLLGLGTTACVAALVALGTIGVLRWLAGAPLQIRNVIAALCERRIADPRADVVAMRRRRRHTAKRTHSIRRSVTRGPPRRDAVASPDLGIRTHRVKDSPCVSSSRVSPSRAHSSFRARPSVRKRPPS